LAKARSYLDEIMIKAICFDFGQTLVDSADGFRLAEKTAQGLIFRDMGLDDFEFFMTIYRNVRKVHYDNSGFSRFSIWQDVYKQSSCTSEAAKLEKWEIEYWEQVQKNTCIFPEVIEVLEALSNHYKLAVITNTQGQKTPVEHRFHQYPELEDLFEVIIVAGEAGIPPKPDNVPFQECIQRLFIEPGETIYVGDDWRIDVCGSQDAGMQPIWLQHHLVRRTWPDVQTCVPIITSLKSLLDIDKLLS